MGSSVEDVKKSVKDLSNGLAAVFYDAGIQKIVTRYKCLNLHSHYVKK
jgi:hypothetical protein